MTRPLRIYFWLAFGFTWGVGGLGLLVGAFRPDAVATHPLHYIPSFGPSLAGVIMIAVTGGGAAVRRMFMRALPRWAGLPWYLAVIVGFPATCVAVTWCIAPDALREMPSWSRLVYLLPITFFLDTGPLGEEFGWRGFALPTMLARWSPIAAAVVLGLFWFAWHLPTFFISTLSQSHLSIPLFVVNSVALSIVMTWLYLRTKGDLLLMIFVHVMANYVGELGVPFHAEVIAEVVMAAAVMAWWGLRPPSEFSSGSPSGAGESSRDAAGRASP